MTSGGEPVTAPARLAAIWAQDRRGVIGVDGTLPWHLPAEFVHFRDTTRGATVVMGRTTWESLPERFRPLPGRRNVVLTRDAAYDAPGAEVVSSLADALAVGSTTGTTWVIGGGSVYAAAMPLLDELVVTEVDVDAAGAEATYAPEIDVAVWAAEPGPWRGGTAAEPGPRWRVVRYRKA